MEEQSGEKATTLYRAAAERGYPPAQCNLGWGEGRVEEVGK